MPSKAVGLTDAKIRGLTPPSSGQVELLDQLVGGLRIRVGASGGKTFILRKRVGGSVSIGVQKGPPIGVQKGPPLSSGVTGMAGVPFALVAA